MVINLVEDVHCLRIAVRIPILPMESQEERIRIVIHVNVENHLLPEIVKIVK